MSIPAVETTTPTGMFGPITTTTTPAAAGDKEMFLQLLVAQMKYQDPMNPTDSSQFLAQSAQFTALEKMQAVADQTSQLVATQMAFGATSLVGKQVSYLDQTGVAAGGLVSGVTFGADGPVLDIAGTAVPLGSVQSVATAPASSTTASTTPSA
ncbi:flagellar hook assembly protein FlgD [uncultured Nocardioides sp.]|uniref:Flagellar basal-body rod modification protein FlgD n=1 Tax=uncultured Nocardioides sp. TaxID=198441 RepID=A0A6J4NY95_9ACTN|nr:flagellar hook capping FlgD N-terminal domain-containing protein [uncultured Nocardioides sp.]CAA9401158.1 MAG: Flagellar basal-body rod modification protein FlgD [uncultured Nocardioides sp.]